MENNYKEKKQQLYSHLCKYKPRDSLWDFDSGSKNGFSASEVTLVPCLGSPPS